MLAPYHDTSPATCQCYAYIVTSAVLVMPDTAPGQAHRHGSGTTLHYSHFQEIAHV